MAYYDFNGTITIDENAARQDIQKIISVLPDLESAKNVLEQLREQGSVTKGDTGCAVVEKADELIKKLMRIIQVLQETQDTINHVVKHYQELDRKVKEAIQASNIVVR